MSELIREPQQQRSIDKKNRIIEAGYELFAEQGYFSINTIDIAKRAGVSTGIVYSYFHDKRDILLEVLDLYIENVYRPIFEMFEKIEKPIDFDKIIPHVIKFAVEIHEQNAAIHETLYSLTPTDKTVSEKFSALEGEITERIARKLTELGYSGGNIKERVHLAMETVQSYAHERVYDKHPYINYKEMNELVTKMLISLFE